MKIGRYTLREAVLRTGGYLKFFRVAATCGDTMYKRRAQKSYKMKTIIVIALFLIIFLGGFAPVVGKDAALALTSISAVGVLSIFFFSIL